MALKRRAGMLLAALLLLVLTASCAEAQVSMEASVGYDGTVFGGRWFPLEVTITSDAEALDGVVAVDVALNTTDNDRYEYPVSIAAGETATLRFPICMLASVRSYEVVLSVDGKERARTEALVMEAVPQEAYVIGVLGGDDALVDSLNSRGKQDVLGRQDRLAAVSVDEAFGTISGEELSAFAALVIDAYDVGALGEAQLEQLAQWIEAGGTVILGPGKGAACSTSWFEQLTGVRVGAAAEEAEVLPMLLAYAGAAAEGGQSAVYPLAAGDDGAVHDAQGRCLLAVSDISEGHVITCGFSLTDEQVLASARNNALWQRLLIAVDANLYNSAIRYSYKSNHVYDSGVCSALRIGKGVSILPVVIVLAGYALVAGVGLYLLLRRLDRSKLMWFCLPAASAGGVLLVVALSGALGMDDPTAACLRVTHYDETGRVSSEERALVAYPDQTRVTISAEGAQEIARAGYMNYGSAELQDARTLRDVRRFGENPSIELKAVAPWLAQDLVIYADEGEPEGSVTASAWMEADGLHAVASNGTDVALQNAVMFTSLGYAPLGDIPAGETREAVLTRPQTYAKKANGEAAILEGALLQYPRSIGEAIRAYVYPQSQTDPDFSTSQLDKAERETLSLLQNKLYTATASVRDEFSCVLLADSPEIACTKLYKDGEEITRNEQVSVMAVDMAFEPVSDSGHFYYPKGTFQSNAAKQTADGPVLSETAEREYLSMNGELLFGFDLSPIAGEKVSTIQIITEIYGNGVIELQVYDNAAGDWVYLTHAEQTEISGELVQRVLDSDGHLFLRYTSEDFGDGLYPPAIIVEGGEDA